MIVPPVEPSVRASTFKALRVPSRRFKVDPPPTTIDVIADGVAKPPRNASTLPDPVTDNAPVVEA